MFMLNAVPQSSLRASSELFAAATSNMKAARSADFEKTTEDFGGRRTTATPPE